MKPVLHFVGMYGIGDCLHQRAVVRELMRDFDVWLQTCHVWMHQDLVEQGLKLILRPTTLWMHVQNIERERRAYPGVYRDIHEMPTPARTIKNWYLKREIDRFGSILETMYGVAGLKCDKPDFSLPVRPEWNTARVDEIVATARSSGKPLMIYRPIVLRKEWDSKQRNPDPDAYEKIYASVREDFFTVSVASLRKDVEWIVGREQPADLKIHDGRLSMPEMYALFSRADIVFCNAGMAPVVAQAVRVPSVVVYGGRESYRTTQRAGAHLAPTLGIDPVNPCDCHGHTHDCDKRIDVPAAIIKVMEFIRENIDLRNDLRGHAGEAGRSELVVQNG